MYQHFNFLSLSLSMQVKELLDPEVARDITEQARNIATD